MGVGYNPNKRFNPKPFNYEEQNTRMQIYKDWRSQTSVGWQSKAVTQLDWRKDLNLWFNRVSQPRTRGMPYELSRFLRMGPRTGDPPRYKRSRTIGSRVDPRTGQYF